MRVELRYYLRYDLFYKAVSDDSIHIEFLYNIQYIGNLVVGLYYSVEWQR